MIYKIQVSTFLTEFGIKDVTTGDEKLQNFKSVVSKTNEVKKLINILQFESLTTKLLQLLKMNIFQSLEAAIFVWLRCVTLNSL